MAGIRFEGVSKRFKNVRVIKGLDLEINDGEFFTFVGPSGCGKSTILNMIAGLEPVSGGTIYFGPEAVNGLGPKERDIAMVFQSYALYPHMDVAQNLAFPLRMKRCGREVIEAEVKRIAEFLGLQGLLHRKPKHLSGGQRQRVALGRAIIRKPRVFLMDEPLSNLDARLRVEMRAELKRLHRELKITTVYVTHDQAEAMGLSERVTVLKDGDIQQCGTPAEVYTRPANAFVAGFIGSPSMNFLESKVTAREPFGAEVCGIALSPPVTGIPAAEKVSIGIRPEDITATEKGPARLRAVVDLVEEEGPVTWLDVKLGEISMKARAAPDETIKPGQEVSLQVPENKIHVFDIGTGRRL